LALGLLINSNSKMVLQFGQLGNFLKISQFVFANLKTNIQKY